MFGCPKLGRLIVVGNKRPETLFSLGKTRRLLQFETSQTVVDLSTDTCILGKMNMFSLVFDRLGLCAA